MHAGQKHNSQRPLISDSQLKAAHGFGSRCTCVHMLGVPAPQGIRIRIKFVVPTSGSRSFVRHRVCVGILQLTTACSAAVRGLCKYQQQPDKYEPPFAGILLCCKAWQHHHLQQSQSRGLLALTPLLQHSSALQAVFRITVNGGGNGQAAKDVQRLDSKLDSEDASVWGTLKTDFDLQSTTASALNTAARSSAGLAPLALALLLAVLAL
eukprot:1146660-Pelagomonas_calceolata.AAC.2